MTYRRDVPPDYFACDDPEGQWMRDTEEQLAALVADKADDDRDRQNAEDDR